MTNHDFLSKLQWKSLWLVSLCQSCGYTYWWMSSPSILSFLSYSNFPYGLLLDRAGEKHAKKSVYSQYISSLARYLRYVCIRGVFILTTECASLTVTLVVTLRKFLSLIISILYFHNPFTAWHWVGTAVVFLGTLLYTEVWSSIRVAMKGEKADTKAE